MPFFSPKTWKQRIVEFPGRRRLDDTSSADVYDVSRAEGTVTQEGDGFTAANMNDLEQRINNAVNDVAGLSADEYDPNATYSSGDLRIHDNILHKANQDISVAEPWTPAHWDATTIAAELKAQAEDISDLNSRIKFQDVSIGRSIDSQTENFYTGVSINIPAKSFYSITAKAIFSNNPALWVGIGDSSSEVARCYDNANTGLNHASCSTSGYTGDAGVTLYVWAKYTGSGKNNINIKGYYITVDS